MVVNIENSNKRSSVPVKKETGELQETFVQLKKLFDFADKNLSADSSFDDYVHEEREGERMALSLPAEFQSLVAEYPGEYFVVYYTNRNSSYYKKGTRGRTLGLSTFSHRGQFDERIREIEFQEPDPADRDSHMYVNVQERVNEKSFATINTANEDEIERPHGSAEITYALDSLGSKQTMSAVFSRLDEGMFDWRGSQKPVRWVRGLHVKSDSPTPEFIYKDLYIVGRDTVRTRDERAQVRTIVKGNLENPQSVRVEIGIGSGVSGRVIYADNQIQVFINNPIGAYKNELEILSQDPNYTFLLKKESFNVAQLLSTMQSKIRMLQEDWDKPHAVFASAIEKPEQKKLS